MSKIVIGFMLVDAPHSALNNAGLGAGERTENIIRVKTIERGRNVYPYVSGQALRYWWRSTLESKFGWNLSPLEREEKIVYSEANPLKYPDDDVFGYMRAPKGRGSETVTRLSPLKVSPLISVIPQTPTQDFGTAARHEGDPVPYEHEFYSTVLKGIFSLDIERVGIFTSENRTGYKNITSTLEEELQKSNATEDNGKWVLPIDDRKKRAIETIKALPYLFGGAMSARHLTDVTPKLLVLATINGGNHIFMNIAKEVDREATISLEALEEVAKDYSKNLLTSIYVGRRKGFMDELGEGIQELVERHGKGKRKLFIYGSINETVDAFVEEIPKLME